MNTLELFSGTESFSKQAKKLNFNTTTLDIDSQWNPDICEDILDWDYRKYEPKHFDFIWASPDCTSWSIATNRHRTINSMSPKTDQAKIGELLIHKTLEIIKYFKPKYWLIENPRGRLRHFIPMKGFYRVTVYYGNYGHPCHKPTDLWCNFILWDEHKDPTLKLQKFKYAITSGKKAERSVIPPLLIDKIIKCCKY